MSIFISDDIVLGLEDVAEGINNNNPRIGWHSIVTAANISADSAAGGFPASNASLKTTYVKWQSASASPQRLIVQETATVNYFAVAGHNLQGSTIKFQSSANGSDWDDVTPEFLPGTNHAIMYEFEDTTAPYFALHITPAGFQPSIAVFNVGTVLRVQRRLYVGHSPLTLNRDTDLSTGVSENGHYLGRVKRSQLLETQVALSNITPSWYREKFDPFVEAAEELPFFWAWRPGEYPTEVGFGWLNGDPRVTNSLPNGMMEVHLSMKGIR